MKTLAKLQTDELSEPQTPSRSTPWGHADFAERIADGIWQVSTPGHGGLWISADRKGQMAEPYRNIRTFAGGRWYEEDCDWCLVALSFPQYFTPEQIKIAHDTYRWLQANSDGRVPA